MLVSLFYIFFSSTIFEEEPFPEQEFQVPGFLNSFVYAAPPIKSNLTASATSSSQSQVLLPKQQPSQQHHQQSQESLSMLPTSHTDANTQSPSLSNQPTNDKKMLRSKPISFHAFERSIESGGDVVMSPVNSENLGHSQTREFLNTSNISSTVTGHIQTVGKAIGLLEVLECWHCVDFLGAFASVLC